MGSCQNIEAKYVNADTLGAARPRGGGSHQLGGCCPLETLPLGTVIRSRHHHHPLTVTDLTREPLYSLAGGLWCCDVCAARGAGRTARHCALCNFDVCISCDATTSSVPVLAPR
eukprot:gnl/Spiro4/5473_TR2773_c0_g1_i1.p2 gnl/Spiro4/5473_TR2773_c0_g1~~gnl/Spiro4/5473_TR2773_c0_g1_i1.p2  ORF type:complete len:114 (+),score=12.43 gnl/Spiro4/5473_TR2773_c0_g1_i1:45-386(+)